jgi:ribonucleoside-diphosphate reductase subunit M2
METILSPGASRYAYFPVTHDALEKLYTRAEKSFWRDSEVTMNEDYRCWTTKLTDDERQYIEMILAFFAGSDGIVLENLALRFYNEVQLPEAKAFYAFQVAMETVHSRSYSKMLRTLIHDEEHLAMLFRATEEIPVIKKKADWAIRYITGNSSFASRLVAFACVEGIFFSSSFAAIHWLNVRKLMPGLVEFNILISRDETLHTEFAYTLYQLLDNPLDESMVHEIIRSAVALETEFTRDCIKCEMIGLRAEAMVQYVECMGDRLAQQLGYSSIYGRDFPETMRFTENLGVETKTQFFEQTPQEYQKADIDLKQTLSAVSSDDF